MVIVKKTKVQSLFLVLGSEINVKIVVVGMLVVVMLTTTMLMFSRYNTMLNILVFVNTQSTAEAYDLKC